MPTRPKGSPRSRLRPVALLLTLTSLFTLAPLPYTPSASAAGQTLWWNESEGNSYTEFGPNEAITIGMGTMNYVTNCSRSGGVKDFLYPWTDIYIVPAGSVSIGSALTDVSGAPNSVQGVGGGLFMGETIGYTAPGGTVGEGLWAVVYDECEDGYFDAEDALFDPAFRVVVPEGAVPDLPGLADLKAKAAQAEQEWRLFHKAVGWVFKFAGKKDKGNFLQKWIARAGKWGLLQDPRTAALNHILNVAERYKGIAADPPDPQFQQVTELEPRELIDPLGEDPFWYTASFLGSQASAEETIAEALLHSMERYQGAQAANDPNWALVHAQQLQDYANYLDLQLGRTNMALQQLANAVTTDPRDFAAEAAEWRAFQTRVAAEGFTEEELRDFRHLGLSDAEIEQIRTDFLAEEVDYSNADFVALVNRIIANNTALQGDLQQLWNDLQPIAVQLQSHPGYAPFAPVADAGGPYTGNEGTAITLNGSGSQSPTPITAYAWDIDLDGQFDDATGMRPTVTLGRDFRGFVGLKVTNSGGASNVAYTPITVNNVNRPPTIISRSPAAPAQTLDVGSTGTFAVTASDPEGDAVNVSWELNGSPAGTGSSYTWTAAEAEVGAHLLTALVADDSPLGGTTRVEWQVDVLYPDQDGDGWRANLDCRDDDDAVNPGQPEIPGNGKDDDCNPATSDDVPLAYLPPADQNASEGGGHFIQLGSFASHTAVGPFTITVDWGDGSGPQVLGTAPEPGAIGEQLYAYADDGIYTVGVSVTADSGETAAGSFRVNVANLPPEATLVVPAVVQVGSTIPVELTGVSDASPVDEAAGFHWALDCGTGYGPVGPLVSGSAACPAPAAPTTLTIRAKVIDKDGGESEYTATVQVVEDSTGTAPTAAFVPGGSGRNVALAEYNATIHSSSGQYGPSYPPDRMLTYATSDNYWRTPSGQTSGWAIIDLGTPTPVLIDRIAIQPTGSNERVKDFAIAVSTNSTDDADFVTVLTATAENNDNLQTFTLPEPVPATYIKYTALNNRGSATAVSTRTLQAFSGQFGGATVTFQNRSTDLDGDLTGYHWDFGDGSTSAEVSPTHTYAAPGTYTVTLTATDAEGNTDTTALSYTVLQPPTVEIKVTTTGPREGAVTSFTAAAADPDGGVITSYRWEWGDGTAPSTLTNVNTSHTYVDNGDYTVTLTVTDDQGQTASVQRVVSVANAPPSGSAGSSQTTFWGVPVANTNASASDPSTVDRQTLTCAWDLGDGTTVGPGPCSDSSILRPTHTYTDPGTYTRRLTITDKDGASITYSNTVTVNIRGSRVIYQGPRTASAGAPIILRARLRDLATGEPVVGETLTFRVAGEILTAVSDGAGIATASVSSLPRGDHGIDIEYAGSTYFTGHTAYDRLIVGAADDALVTPAATLSPSDLQCGLPTHVTLQVTGVPPTTSTVPLDVALVIDVSGSMAGNNITAARAAARQFVQIIDRESDGVQDGTIRGSQIALVPFESAARMDTNLTGDAALLEQRIQSLTASGGTSIHLGIDFGRDELAAGAKPGNKPIMIVLSDGGSDRNRAFQSANAAKAAGIELFSIALGNGADQVLMEGIASEPKEAHFFHSPTPQELEQIYRTIAQTATGPAATDLTITVEVDPNFALDAASITPTPDLVTVNQISWSIPELVGETRTFSYSLTHQSGAGSLPVQTATLTYTDTKGDIQTKPFPALVADVTCGTLLSYQGDLEGMSGATASLAARLTAPDGTPLAGQTLTFDLNGITAAGQTGPDGIATAAVTLALPAGVYDLAVRFAGAGGYLPAEDAVAFTVRAAADNQAPVTTITPSGTAGENGWFISPVTVTLSAIDLPSGTSDDVASTEYSLDGGANWHAYSGPFVLTDDGLHTILAQSTDIDGIQEDPPAAAEIRIDQTPPDLSADPASGSAGTPVALTAAASDLTSGIDRVEWDLDHDGTYDAEGSAIDHTWSAAGSYTVGVRATDRAGNQTEATVAVEIGDVAPCQPFGWRAPLGSGTAEVSLADNLLIAFSYGCDEFIRDESVIITVSDKATGEEVTAWVYELFIEIDEAAGEYRVLFEPAFYGLTAGQELEILVFMDGEVVGEAAIRITD